MKPSDFYTREKANEGVKLPLSLPDGTPTEHYLIIRGVDSDAFRKAQDASLRAAVELAQEEDKEAVEARLEALRLDVLVALVAGWSFDSEFTPEAVAEFLREAPHIAQKVDRIAGDRARFFAMKSAGSSSSQKPSSDSSSRRKTQKPRSDNT